MNCSDAGIVVLAMMNARDPRLQKLDHELHMLGVLLVFCVIGHSKFLHNTIIELSQTCEEHPCRFASLFRVPRASKYLQNAAMLAVEEETHHLREHLPWQVRRSGLEVFPHHDAPDDAPDDGGIGSCAETSSRRVRLRQAVLSSADGAR